MNATLHRLHYRWPSLLAFTLAWRMVTVALLTPIAALVLRLCLAQRGQTSAGNFEIVAFFLAPAGWLAIVCIGAILLAIQYFEHAGLMRLWLDGRLLWWQAFQGSARLFPRLLQLGLWQVAVYFVVAIPFLAGIGLVYWHFLSGQDLNGLLILRPPEFWQAVGCAGVLVLIYAILAVRLFVGWLLAVPMACFEPVSEPVRSPAATLRLSAQRMHGRWFQAGRLLALWAVSQAVLGIVVFGLLGLASRPLLFREEASLSTAAAVAGVVLAVHWLAGLILNMLASGSFAGVVLHLYRAQAPEGLEPAIQPTSTGVGSGWRVALAAVGMAVIACIASLLTLRDLTFPDAVEITAHRAGAVHAPENTVAALRRAIADGADWAEIDVQLAADGALVILHDIDLARVGGGKRRVDQATLSEIQALDVGAAKGPDFAGERIPTLKQMLNAAGDKIRLNVELKPHGAADGPALTRRVVAEISQAGMTPRCRICSQSYESLLLVKQLEPSLETGYIAGAAVGDPAQRSVDFLMLNSSLVTSALVHRAASRGIAVHAWTVNNPEQAGPLLDAGASNLITDDPALIRAKVEALQALSPVERLLLKARHALR